MFRFFRPFIILFAAMVLLAFHREIAHAQSVIVSSNYDVARYAYQAKGPGGSLTAATPATVTLSAAVGGCPRGIRTAPSSLPTIWSPLYISGGTGTAEVVTPTGGTCTSGASSGNVTFTPANNHTGAWTIQSATSGIQEAINDAASSRINPYPSVIGPLVPGWGWANINLTAGVFIVRAETRNRWSGIHIVGAGPSATIIRCQLVSSGNCLHWDGGTTARWQASTAYALGDTIMDDGPAHNGERQIERVTAVTGDDKTGGSAPSWPSTTGTTTTDNHVTWTNDGGAELHDSSISDLTIDGVGSSSSIIKTGVVLYDVAEFSLKHVYIRTLHDTTHASTCLELHGREHIQAEDLHLFCNRAWKIGVDDYTAVEGLDRSSFDNFEAANVDDTGAGLVDNPVLAITETDAFLTNVAFSNCDFLYGSESVFWSNTVTKSVVSRGVSFNNCRNEGGPVANYAFDIEPPSNAPLHTLVFSNMDVLSATLGGWKLRNILSGGIENSTYNTSASVMVINADSTVHGHFAQDNLNTHSSNVYGGLNGWCGLRYGLDPTRGSGPAVGIVDSGQIWLRSCGDGQVILEGLPGTPVSLGGTATSYTVTAASCSSNLLTYTIGAGAAGFEAGGQIIVDGTNINPSTLGGTYNVISQTGTTVTVVSDQCPVTYSSGGTNVMTYAPPAFMGTNSLLTSSNPGDLMLRAHDQILMGFSGLTVLGLNTGYEFFMDAAGTTKKAYIGSNSSILSGWASDAMQIRSDASDILFGFSGTTMLDMNANYLTFNNASGTAKAYFGVGSSILTGYTAGDLQIRSDSASAQILLGTNGTTSTRILAAGISIDTATPTGGVGAGQVGFGSTFQNAGVGTCPAAAGTFLGLTFKCIVINDAGTGRNIMVF